MLSVFQLVMLVNDFVTHSKKRLKSFSSTFLLAQTGMGTLKGTVKDAKSGEPIPYCKVLVKQNGNIKGGANTDFDGKFQISSIAAGSYDVEVRNEDGYQGTIEQGVVISSNSITFLDKLQLYILDNVIIEHDQVTINKAGYLLTTH